METKTTMQTTKRVLSPSKVENVPGSCKRFKNQNVLSVVQPALPTEQENYDFLLDDDNDFDVSALDAAITAKKIDLSCWQRSVVRDVERMPKTHDLLLHLRSEGDETANGATAVCHLQAPWNQTPVQPGDLLSLKAHWQPALGAYVVNKEHGFCVIHPDLLISSTSVTGSLFCRRKAVLQDRFRGVDAANAVVSSMPLSSRII